MDEKLREYIDRLFVHAPKTRKTVELREEMIQNIREKYYDLIQDGKSEDDAYSIAVRGIGDISELIAELKREEEMPGFAYLHYEKQRSAVLIALAVVVYILSLIPYILTFEFGWNRGTCVLAFLIIIAAATGMLVYGLQIRPKYIKANDSVVEEFKEFSRGRHNNGRLRLSMSFALWSIVLAIYLAVSMLTWRWQITWLIFPAGLAFEALITVYLILKK